VWHDWGKGDWDHSVVCKYQSEEEAARLAEEERLAAEATRSADDFIVNCDKRHYSESIAYCESQGFEIASIHNQ